MKYIITLISIVVCSVIITVAQPQYTIYKTKKNIEIDGDIKNIEWRQASWTANFVDIVGRAKDKPQFQTRVKMLWDDEYLYIAAEMTEPHIWATITERDAVMYWDNDFEVFIDVYKNGLNYYEFEFNANNAQWDLMMTKPYFQKGTFINEWDVEGLKTAVKIDGTLNDPSDIDDKWTMEIAIPLKELVKKAVKIGDTWRMNFSRVQWLKYEMIDGMYQKIKGTDKFGFENNWVWSPTGVVDIHRPDSWGVVTFE